MSDGIRKAQVLINLERWKEAQDQLNLALSSEPDNSEGHALMGYVLLQQNLPLPAQKAATTAISLEPEEPFNHFVLGLVHIKMSKWASALTVGQEILRLDPDDSNGYCILAAAYHGKRKYKDALKMAEAGLAIDPQSGWLQDVRSHSLQMRGHGKAAQAAAYERLAIDPDDPASHRNLGWNHHLAGRHREAEAAFSESLRMDPTDESSREGLLSSLRARFIPYRVIFAIDAFFLRLPHWVGIAAWIGVPQVFRMMRRSNSVTPEAAIFFVIAQAIVTILIYLSWSAGLLANATLIFHPVGRYALARHDKLEAVLAAILAIFAFAGAVCWLSFNSFIGFAAAFIAMLVSGIMGGIARRWEKELWRPGVTITIGFFGVAVCLGLAGFAMAGMDGQLDAAKMLTSSGSSRVRPQN